MDPTKLKIVLNDLDSFIEDLRYELGVSELPPEGIDVEELTESTFEEGAEIVVDPEVFVVLCEIEQKEIPDEICIRSNCVPWDEEINDGYAKSGYVMEVEVTYQLIDKWNSGSEVFVKYKLSDCSSV